MNLPDRDYPFATVLVSADRWPSLKRIAAAAGTIALCVITVILVMFL